jgi:hypothetical protein
MFKNFLNFCIDVYHFISNKALACFGHFDEAKDHPFSLDEKKNSNTLFPSERKKARSVYTYKKNGSAALQLPITKTKLERLQSDPATLLYMCNEYILEHASRKADIFFYLLVALYNCQLKLKQGPTVMQHGKGQKSTTGQRLTNACHSNLFPNILVNANDENIFAGLHLMNTMNSTVELPIFVNQLDSELEGKIQRPSLFRKKSFEILQTVSDGKLDPVDGFKQFLNLEKDALNILKNQDSKKSYLYRKSGPSMEIKLQLLRIFGKSTCCDDDIKFKKYINLLLRLKPAEIIKLQISPKIEKKIHLEKIRLIQEEIFEAKSELKKKK